MADGAATSNTLTVKAETAIDHFYQGLANIAMGYQRIVTLKGGMADMVSYKPTDLSGVSAFAAQSGADAPAADAFTSSGASYTAPAYEKRLTVTEYEIETNPGILTDLAQQVLDSAASTIATLVWGALAAPDAILHPDTTMTGAGGSPYLADVFSAPVSQQNLYTTALSASTLAINKAALRAYKDKDGRPQDFLSGGVAIVVPSGLEDLAQSLAGRMSEIYDGSSLQNAQSWGLASSPVIVNPYASDANDWMTIALGGRNPFCVWMPRTPTFRLTPFPSAGRVEMYASYRVGMAYKPFEGGFVFNKVA